jgi:arginase
MAILTGDAWQGMLTTVPGARPLPDTAVLQAGARDFDEGETARFEDSAIGRVAPEDLATGDALARALAELEPEPTGLYLHIDLDVLDAEEAAVNIYSSTGGITGEQLAARVDDVLRTGLVRAVSLTAYDPECDPEGRIPPVAERLLGAVALSARAAAPGAS